MSIRLIACSALLLLTAHVQAADLSGRQIKQSAQYCLNKTWCYTQELAYPDTGHAAIDQWAKNQLKKLLKIQNLSKSTLRHLLKHRMEEDAADLANCQMQFINSFELLGHSPRYAVLGEEDWAYTCGAHGNGVYQLFVLPQSGHIKPLSLQEIVLPNAQPQLEQLQLAAFKRFLAQEIEMNDADIAGHLAIWTFESTDNWRLAKNGLVFQFQNYEITPYAMGRPEIFIAAQDLRGIIREDILRETENYRDK